MEYQHPMAWAVQNIKNEEMAWIFICQLNETGRQNLAYFAGLHADADRRAFWETAFERAKQDKNYLADRHLSQ